MAMPPTPPVSSPTASGVAGAGTQPGQPPFGSSPAQMPTPDRGGQAAALALVSTAVRILERALPQLGAGSDPGKDVMKALQNLTKHVPQGATSPGVENSAMQQMMLQGKQNASRRNAQSVSATPEWCYDAGIAVAGLAAKRAFGTTNLETKTRATKTEYIFFI